MQHLLTKEYLVKLLFGSEMSLPTDRQTDMLTTILRCSTGGRVEGKQSAV